MVPYSQLPIEDHVQIIEAYENEKPTASVLNENNSIDESTIRNVVRNYKLHWKQRLLSHKIKLNPLELLVRQCLDLYSRQFMQIKTTINYLFLCTT